MKKKRFYLLASFGITLLTGIFLGAVFQKVYGIGNLLRGIGIPYPTSAPIPATPNAVEIPQNLRGEILLFILAGQSNMTGWAPVPDNQIIDPNIYVFGNDYHWRVALEPVDDATGQVDEVSKDRAAKFGPSLAFATAFRSLHPELVIGLIPCAKSSSAIIEWQRNLRDQSLYGSCLKRARAASPMGHFAGILIFQGETDAVNTDHYPQFRASPAEWSAMFTAFVTDFRADLAEPDLPVVFAQIGTHSSNTEEFPNWELVKDQQRSTKLPMTAMITTDALPQMDGLHFTTESYQMIGERFAAAYEALIAQDLSR